MSADDRTDRYRPVFEPEDIFDRFVRHANASAPHVGRDDEPTMRVESTDPGRAPVPDPEGTTPDAPSLDAMRREVVLLTKVKRPSSWPPPPPSGVTPIPPYAPPSSEVVPDVRSVERRSQSRPLPEGREDGQIPSRELDRLLSDMAVLLRYGHRGQVREKLDRLRQSYPSDLLLLRRIAEFHVEHEDVEAALETLFALASALFERRNVVGMRQALEQVLVLDPDNPRAYRLLGLLEQRPDTQLE